MKEVETRRGQKWTDPLSIVVRCIVFALIILGRCVELGAN